MAYRTLPEAEYLRQCFDYDPDTGALVWRWRPREHFPSDTGWRSANCFAGKQFGFPKKTAGGVYFNGTLNGTGLMAHRIIWKMMTGEEPAAQIDHRDGDGLNNRWKNMREATHDQNVKNCKDRAGIWPRGVSWRPCGYVASISHEGVRIYLGLHKTPELAHAAYLAASKRLHEEFSFTNREMADAVA